jgi:hypothetical protein
MAIPESQFETWAHQGSITQSKNTYATIKSALEDSASSYYGKSFEVFLQGSYGNDTNIYGESDVDVVIRLDSIFRSNIRERPTEEQTAYNRIFSDATYSFDDFKAAVQAVLIKRFGANVVKPGNKAITIAADASRRSADVVVCYQYRTYQQFDPQKPNDCTLGIIIPSASGDIINYPKLHSANLTELQQATVSMFKPMVRIFKNMRSQMVEEGMLRDGTAPSYYLEGLFYNVPAEQYVASSYGDTFCNGVNWLLKADRKKLVCANWQYWLLGNSNVQWNEADFDSFLSAVCKLWKEWK